MGPAREALRVRRGAPGGVESGFVLGRPGERWACTTASSPQAAAARDADSVDRSVLDRVSFMSLLPVKMEAIRGILGDGLSDANGQVYRLFDAFRQAEFPLDAPW